MDTAVRGPHTDFDYVIVGGGSAGCVVAARLSEVAHSSVCLLEAGPSDWNPAYRIPMLAGRLYRARANNWFYQTEPQTHLDERQVFWPRGKILGGSFIFNGMVYIRGNAADFDGWAQKGNSGWSYDDVLPAFRKSEAYCEGEGPFHGGDGPLPVNRPLGYYSLFQRFVAAGREAGHPLNADFNGASQDGVGFYHFNIRDGRRQTTAASFLKPARRRANLTIMTRAMSHRLVIERDRVVGVEILRRGGTEVIRARREVILCAGAINTPQLMLLSGIGPGDHLTQLDIPVRHELPGVGENLHDHLDVALAYTATKPVSMVDNLRLDRFLMNLGRAAFGAGPAGASPIESGGFFRSRDGLATPDLQAFMLPIAATNASLWSPFSQRPIDTFAIRVGQVRPLSRGHLRLRSRDPLQAPLLQPNYLEHPTDLPAQIAGVRIVRDIIRQAAFDDIRGQELAPGPRATTDDAIAAWIRSVASSVFHPVGTARMGTDAMAVVDPELRVHGLRGLRVADASVMPDIVGGNTNAATIMIAERGAEFIRKAT